VRCWRGDGLGLARLKQLGVHLAILSTEINPVVTARSRKLGVRCTQGLPDKYAALNLLLDELGLTLGETAFVGNDINDLACLTGVGLPIVVQDAHPDVIPHAAYQTVAPGGRGAVREVCDLLAGVLTAQPDYSLPNDYFSL
jgi:YrbI family 3-deoxy-D-manno-octulosonate 8-phosphate phosphatase